MARRMLVMGLALAGGLAGGGAQAVDRIAGMGPLDGVLQIGSDGAWTGAVEDSSYVLANDQADESIRYFFVTSAAGEEGARRVSVKVDVEGGRDRAAAGLLYGLSPDKRSYYMFGMGRDGTANLFHRVPGDMKRMASAAGGFIRSTGFNELSLVEKGAAFDAYVNGERVMTIDEAPGAGRGGVGIVAWGRGRFVFRDFAVDVGSAGAVARTAAALAEAPAAVVAQAGNAAGEAQQPTGPAPQAAPQTVPAAPPTIPPPPPAGQMPMGQMPMGQMPMGQTPMGQMPMGQTPMGQTPMGQMPMGQMPMGQTPMVQTPMGQMPMGQMPMGQMPMGQTPMGQTPMVPPAGMQPAPGVPQPAVPGQPPVLGQPIVPMMPGQLPQAQPVAPLPGQPVVQADTTGDAGARAILDFAKQVTQIQSTLQVQAAVPAGWDRYVDPGTGMVSAAYPKGWTINPVVRGLPGLYVQYAQVQISSPDGYNFIEGVTTQQSTYANPEAYAEQLVNQYAGRFGIRRVMLEDSWSVPRQMMPINFVYRAVEAGDYVVVVVASSSAINYAGMAMSFLGYRVVIGPTAQFSSLAQSTYIPILSSMLGW